MERKIQIIAESVFEKVLTALAANEKADIEQIRKLLMDSFDNGETIYRTAKIIEVTSKGNFKVSSESILHSAFAAAQNAVTMEAFREAGFTKKRWLTARDGKVRPQHQVLEGKTVSINEPFRVGNSLLMFPGEPSPNLEDWIECRCALLSEE
ncbi:MAG: phage minor head protein [Limisphaerales bacterium]